MTALAAPAPAGRTSPVRNVGSCAAGLQPEPDLASTLAGEALTDVYPVTKTWLPPSSAVAAAYADRPWTSTGPAGPITTVPSWLTETRPCGPASHAMWLARSGLVLLYSSWPVTASRTSTRPDPVGTIQLNATPVVPAPGIAGLAITPLYSCARLVVEVVAGATWFWYSATVTPCTIAASEK